MCSRDALNFLVIFACFWMKKEKAKRTTGSICLCNKFYQRLFVLQIIKVVDKCNGAYFGCDKKVASLLSLPVRKLCNFVHKWNRLANRTRESTTTTLTQIIINFALCERKKNCHQIDKVICKCHRRARNQQWQSWELANRPACRLSACLESFELLSMQVKWSEIK